jgi:hypothetical protein
LGIASCSDSNDGPKVAGCMDSLSVNYNNVANTDDGSCVFPSDKLIGNWKVKDEVSSFNTSTFVLTPLPVVNADAIITKSDKKIISITSDRPDKPVYIYKGALTIDWKNKKIEVGPGSSVSGTIITENSFTLTYIYGAMPYSYTIKQTYTR